MSSKANKLKFLLHKPGAPHSGLLPWAWPGERWDPERTTAFEPWKEQSLRGSKAAQEARGSGFLPTAQGLQILSGSEPSEGPKAAGRLTLLSPQSRAPSSGARGDGLLRQGILVRKAGWGVQAGAGSSAKQCLGIPEPALCQSWLQHSFMNLASCQGQNQEGSSYVQLALWCPGNACQRDGWYHSTGYKVPQEMGTQPLWLRNQGWMNMEGPCANPGLHPATSRTLQSQTPKTWARETKVQGQSVPASRPTRGTSSFLSLPGHSSQSRQARQPGWEDVFCPPSLYIYGFQATAKNISFSLHQREI